MYTIESINPIISIYFLQSRHGHCLFNHVLILFLKTASEVSYFRKSGISSQIFGADEETDTLPLCVAFVIKVH